MYLCARTPRWVKSDVSNILAACCLYGRGHTSSLALYNSSASANDASTSMFPFSSHTFDALQARHLYVYRPFFSLSSDPPQTLLVFDSCMFNLM